MRARIAAAMAGLVAGLVGGALGGTVRADHCEQPIYLFSYVRTPLADPMDPNRQLGNPTVTSSALGCLIIGEDPRTPGHQADTDYIYPGSDTLVVRWLGGAIPASGTLSFAGQTYQLHFYETTNGLVRVIDSRQIFIDPLSSINGGAAVITVCPDFGGTDCATRTYRTVA